VRGDRRFGRIGRRNPRRDAVHGGAALDVAPHIGLLRRLVGEGYVFHLLQDDETMKRPPAEADAARALHLGKPHHAEIRIRASQGEKEIDVIGRHDATSRLVPRFRSSHHSAARSFANFGIERALATYWSSVALVQKSASRTRCKHDAASSTATLGGIVEWPALTFNSRADALHTGEEVDAKVGVLAGRRAGVHLLHYHGIRHP